MDYAASCIGFLALGLLGTREHLSPYLWISQQTNESSWTWASDIADVSLSWFMQADQALEGTGTPDPASLGASSIQPCLCCLPVPPSRTPFKAFPTFPCGELTSSGRPLLLCRCSRKAPALPLVHLGFVLYRVFATVCDSGTLWDAGLGFRPF